MLFFVGCSYDRSRYLVIYEVENAGDRPYDPRDIPAVRNKAPYEIHREGDAPVYSVVLACLLVEPCVIAFFEQLVKSVLSYAGKDYHLYAGCNGHDHQADACDREHISIV